MAKIGQSSPEGQGSSESAKKGDSSSSWSPGGQIDSFGTFRDYVENTDTVITPFPLGVFNVEGGHVGVASQLLPRCDSCHGYSNGEMSFSCGDCGRSPENYVHVRAGLGDGVYPVYEMAWGPKFVGTMTLLGIDGAFLQRFHQNAVAIGDGKESPDSSADFFWETFTGFPHEMRVDYVATLVGVADPAWNSSEGRAHSSYYFSDVGVGENPRDAIVTAHNIPLGQQDVYIFSSRDPAKDNILVPSILLTLEPSIAKEIGLPSGAQTADLTAEAEKWAKSTVQANIGGNRAAQAAGTNTLLWLSTVDKDFHDEATEWDHRVVGTSWRAFYELLTEGAISEPVLDFLDAITPELAAQLFLLRGLTDQAAGYFDFESRQPGPMYRSRSTGATPESSEGGLPKSKRIGESGLDEKPATNDGPSARFCSSCGTEFSDTTAKFCSVCGAKRL